MRTTRNEVGVTTYEHWPVGAITAAERLEARLRDKNDLVVLQLGDHDPSGEDIYRDIRDKLSGAIVERVGLTPDQVGEYSLPPLPAKASDTRYVGFVRRHGDAAVELDALPPDALQALARAAVERWIDREQVERIRALETAERVRLRGILEEAAKNL